MPNRYEREIEEILRNLDRTEPRQGLGERIRAFNRPRPAPRRPAARLSLSRVEALLVLGIACALIAAGVAYYSNTQTYISGGFAVVGFIAIVLGLVIAWNERFRGAPRPTWRGGNVVPMKPPRRRNPFSLLVTRVRIVRLKLRYWRTRGKA